MAVGWGFVRASLGAASCLFFLISVVIGNGVIVEHFIRSRLDRGKILVVIPEVWDTERVISALTEESSFMMKVVIEPLPVDVAWLNHFLDLGSFSSEGGVSELPENEQYTSEFDFQNSRLVGKGCRRGQLSHTVNKASSNLLADKGRRGDDCSCPKSVEFINCGLGGTAAVVDKGKKLWIMKPRHKSYPCPTQNAKLVIGRNQVKGRVLVEDSSSSSTDSERSWGAFCDVNRKQGECSNKSVPGGPSQARPSVVGPVIESLVTAPQDQVLGQVHKISGISIVLGGLPAGLASQPNREPIKENIIQDKSSLGEHSSSSFGEGNKSGSMESGDQFYGGSGKSSDSTNHDLEGNEIQLPPKTPNRRGRKKGPATKSHAMKTRFASRNLGASAEASKDKEKEELWNFIVKARREFPLP
ncbi:hypothetical protein Q3G72_030654 [Acer saccharum]|nr:hypothetical protein Q3G72_030654 [Acer saccharum]